MKEWFLAVRPQTLIISIAPILLSQVEVYQAICEAGQGNFSWTIAWLALACAVALQVSVNLANDYFDYLAGVDGELRQGPARVDGKGGIALEQVKWAFWGALVTGIAIGLILAALSHWVILAAGLACVVAVLAYSSGPWPLAYNALGEVVVFTVFGPIAIFGGFYLQLGELPARLWWPAIAMGNMAAAVMLVNNIRDMASDHQANKITLAIRLGEQPSRLLYLLLLLGAASCHLLSLNQMPKYSWVLIPLLLWLMVNIFRLRGQALNAQLGQTALLMLLMAMAISADLICD